MITHHEIGELDRNGIILRLTPSEARTPAHVTNRLGVEWRSDGSVRVFSKGQVGSIALSSDTIVSVTTKVPIENILDLASLAYRTVPIPAAVGHALLGSVESGLDWLALLLVTELEELLAHGIRRDYVLVEDDLPYVRGRLRFDPSFAAARPGFIACEFADFLPDIAENRILKATLELLATQHLLQGLRRRLEQLFCNLGRVTLVRPSERLLDSCRITRLNQHYRPALALCRLVLEQAGVELRFGGVSVPAYFLPMELVFQEAVTTFLRRRLPTVYRQFIRTHQPNAGTPPRPLRFAADIVVGVPPQLVIDTKYASPEVLNQYGGWSFHNDHIYQVVFYALSLGCPALLVYPRVDRDVNTTFNIAGVSTTILAIDLAKPGLSALGDLLEAVSFLTETPKVA